MPRTYIDKAGMRVRRFNDWLRGEMKQQKVRQSTLAVYLNITQSALSHRMRGLSEWPLRDAWEVCDYFGKKLEEII